MEDNKKQTAVDWLVSKYFGGINNVTPNFRNKIEQAKEMEKKQIEEAWERGSYSLLDNGSGEDFDEYYDKTYNQ